MNQEIVVYAGNGFEMALPLDREGGTVWASQAHTVELFGLNALEFGRVSVECLAESQSHGFASGPISPSGWMVREGIKCLGAAWVYPALIRRRGREMRRTAEILSAVGLLGFFVTAGALATSEVAHAATVTRSCPTPTINVREFSKLKAHGISCAAAEGQAKKPRPTYTCQVVPVPDVKTPPFLVKCVNPGNANIYYSYMSYASPT